ncbi:MAG TPA: Gfo/Idh/MocA family oxidoreductase [Bryobacteraceae bacterium]|nr:Gfo/Idh/MocA family oxidoreductase [Bryobacteraceae bacterium]
MTKLGMGVVGVGTMGRRHAENIRRLIPEAQLIAVADADAGRARQVAADLEIEHYYNGAESLVERKDIQAVAIVSPAKFHAAAIKACAAAGKDIFCEKPLTLTVEEADDVLAVTAKAGVRLQPGHVRRYDPSHVRAKKRIEAGEIGDPVIFKSLARDPEPPPVSYLASGVNGMFFQDSAVHEFDLGRWMMNDEIAELHAYGAVLVFPEAAQFNDIDTAVVNLKFSRGALGSVENYMQSRYGYDIRTEIVGSKGTIMLGYQQQIPEVVLTASGRRTDVVDHFLVRFADGYLDEMRDFVRVILADREPQVDGFDGRQAVAAAAAAERSYREARPVTLHNPPRPRRP